MKWLTSSIKQNFIAGLVVLVPFGLTIFILYKLVIWLVGIFSSLPAKILTSVITTIPDSLIKLISFSAGLLATLIIVLFIGGVARNFIGGRLVNFGEGLIKRIPLARTIYIAIKQIIETLFFTAEMKKLKRVALIEYPRKGVRSIGFITGTTEPGQHHNASDVELVSIFVPTAPNPTSGYYIMVPKDEVTELDISVEDAFRLILSAGLSTNNVNDPS